MLNTEQINLIWQIVTLILGVLILWNSMIRAFTFFQSAHFNLMRYTNLIIEKLKQELRSVFYYFLLCLPYIVMVTMSNDNYQYSLLVFPSLLYVLVSFYRANKFSNVYFTSQMIRYATAYVIVTSLIVVAGIRLLPTNYYGLFIGFLFIYSWIAIYFIWLILYPLEKILENSLLKKVQQLLADSTITLVVCINNDNDITKLLDKALSLKYKGYANDVKIGTFREVLQTLITKIRPYDEYCLLGIDGSFTDETLIVFKQLPIKYVVINTLEVDDKIQDILDNPEYTIFTNSEHNQFWNAEVVSSSLTEVADYQVISQVYSLENTKFSLLLEGNEYEFVTKYLGESKLRSLVFVISIANTLGVSTPVIIKGLRYLPDDDVDIEIRSYRQRTIVNDRSDNSIEEINKMLEEDKRIKVLVSTCQKDDFQYLLGNEIGFDICIIDISKLSNKFIDSVDKQELWGRNIYLVSGELEAFRKALELTNNNDIILLKNTVNSHKNNLM